MIIFTHKLIFISMIKSCAFNLINFRVGIVYAIAEVGFVVDALERFVAIQQRLTRRQHIWTILTPYQTRI